MTPMMEQYFEIKEQYKDYILFYRLGDFYEMFFDDAIVASRELELTLTGRDCGEAERAPMCGVPFHSSEGYIGKLIEKGYKVAICEQIEDPALAKGLVKRDVISVPGVTTLITAVEEQKRLRAEADKLETQIAEALADIRKYEKEETDVKVRLSVIENARADDDGKNSTTLDEIERYEAVSRELEAKVKKCEESLARYDGMIAETVAEIDAGHEALADRYDERGEREERVAALRLERDSAKQRIDTFRAMEEHFEGYSNSVRFVMKAYAEGKITTRSGAPCGKIYGPLSQVIRVEDRYVTAVETALAANLQHIVVENEETAKAAMFALKRAEAGRATFFPITSMRGQDDTHEMRESRKFEGFVSYADELVFCDGKFREIVSSLLGRTVVFDNIDNATRMAQALKYYVKVVTLDGQQIQVGGSFTGGSVRSRGSILGRAGEIRAIEEKLKGIDTEITALTRELDVLEKGIVELEEKTSSLEDKKRILDVMRSGENTTLEQQRAKLDANNTLADKLRADYGSVVEQNRRYEEEAAELSARDKELLEGIRAISEFRADKDVERHALLEQCEALGARITELYIKRSETQKDIETERTFSASVDERIVSHREGIAAQKRKIEECRAQIAVFEAAQRENRARLAEGEKILAELNAKRALLESDSFEFEKKLSAMNAKIREKRSEQEAIFRENTKNENKLNSLRNEQDKLATKLWDDYELSRAEAVALGYPPITAVTRAATAAKQVDCRNKLRAIGNVDLDAVNKYKEVKERYDYMERQIRDLSDSKQELLKIIDKLESEMKTAFTDAFNRINENFGQTFTELFGGGTAELSLTDPENVLTSGIEIKAAPPGKIIKSLMQLSGGEQSFIAIALLFAILKVNPTPFYIFDEIEAALDEVNVARFAEYIKRYSDGTQFILITHRRGTMEAANRLYGVTMPEHGISKVLALDVNDIAKKKGEDWDGIFG